MIPLLVYKKVFITTLLINININDYCFIEIPRHQSKILAHVKKEDNRAEKRAQTFIAEGSNLRKGGSLEKKDLSNDSR